MDAKPYNLTYLEFDTFKQFSDTSEKYQDILSSLWRWHEILGNKSTSFIWSGVCTICGVLTEFNVTPEQVADEHFEYRVRWQNLRCARCGFDARERAVAHEINNTMSTDRVIYHVGHFSRFCDFLRHNFKSLESSQFKDGYNSGYIDDSGVRYEDLTTLSYKDNSFDCIVCMEILEHVPDYKTAIVQMRRVLRKGGRALLTFPWLGGVHYQHLVRAEVAPDGTINHILPPEYHGDPASGDGILSFRAFGWKILDELREAGFSRASAKFIYGPIHGFMTVMLPVIVAVK